MANKLILIFLIFIYSCQDSGNSKSIKSVQVDEFEYMFSLDDDGMSKKDKNDYRLQVRIQNINADISPIYYNNKSHAEYEARILYYNNYITNDLLLSTDYGSYKPTQVILENTYNMSSYIDLLFFFEDVKFLKDSAFQIELNDNALNKILIKTTIK